MLAKAKNALTSRAIVTPTTNLNRELVLEGLEQTWTFMDDLQMEKYSLFAQKRFDY